MKTPGKIRFPSRGFSPSSDQMPLLRHCGDKIALGLIPIGVANLWPNVDPSPLQIIGKVDLDPRQTSDVDSPDANSMRHLLNRRGDPHVGSAGFDKLRRFFEEKLHR